MKVSNRVIGRAVGLVSMNNLGFIWAVSRDGVVANLGIYLSGRIRVL